MYSESDLNGQIGGIFDEDELTGRFEWHITVDKQYRKEAATVAEDTAWVFSEITGCPILGQGTYCYITGFSKDSAVAYLDMEFVVKEFNIRGVPVLRSKIENIVYDSKTGVNTLCQ
jgi:hypothetical protein